jgi:hypothetical protein
MPSFFRKKKKAESKPSTLKKKKDEEIFDESLLQLHQETNELLKLVNTPAKNTTPSMSSPFSLMIPKNKPYNNFTPSKKNDGDSSKPMAARMTIEVLDDENDEEGIEEKKEEISTQIKKSPEPLMQIPKENEQKSGGSGGMNTDLDLDDVFSFQREEKRVRKGTDTFYPDTVPTKKAVKKQINSFMNEKERLEEIKNAEISMIEVSVLMKIKYHSLFVHFSFVLYFF